MKNSEILLEHSKTEIVSTTNTPWLVSEIKIDPPVELWTNDQLIINHKFVLERKSDVGTVPVDLVENIFEEIEDIFVEKETWLKRNLKQILRRS